MSQWSVLTQLLGLQGWKVVREGIRIEGEVVIVRIERVAGQGFVCSRCGEKSLVHYDTQPARRVRDFPVWGRPCLLEFEAVRVACRRCGATAVEALEWIEPYGRLTLRYERYVAALCDILPVLDVAAHEGLDKATVYRLDKKWLAWRDSLRCRQEVKLLGIDEIAIRKGHVYATVFYDLDRREVIGLVTSRRQRAVSGFFRRMGKAWCRAVEAVCMDLWSAFLASVRIHLKRAVVVFDKFHIYTYLSKAVDEVRRDEQNRAQAQGRQLLKGSRWLWLKRSDSLRRKQRQTLKDIMAVNANMAQAYLLKEDLSRFYECATREEAETFLKQWAGRCKESGLAPFRAIAKRLLRWAGGILAYFTHPITNAVSEGLNNKIKVLKRRAYGFHDIHYFFLKILNITGALPPLEAVVAHTNTE